MPYFQENLNEFLLHKRWRFIHPECMLQLDRPEQKGRHWICDAVTVDFSKNRVYLCEVTLAITLQALVTRLRAWDQNWPELRAAIKRDLHVDWPVFPWVFIPREHESTLLKKLSSQVKCSSMPWPRIFHLEDITPWNESKFEDLIRDPDERVALPAAQGTPEPQPAG